MKRVFGGLLILAAAVTSAQTLDRTPVAAQMVTGEKVLLHPNGRWEYVDAAKAGEAKKLAAQFPENKTRPIEAQGGWFGVGRTVMPGDPDYNRGSLNPKTR